MKSVSPKLDPDLAFRAFSDPTRLRILHLLLGGELCVCDLVNIIQTPQPTASRHLAYLRRANLVTSRFHGNWAFYALAPARGNFHKKLLECLAQCSNEMSALARDSARARKHMRSGGCCPR